MPDGITVAERAEIYGVSYREQRELEEREPWIGHWSARYGSGAENLRDYLAAGSPVADRKAFCIAGDRSIVDATRDALSRLPEAVAHFVIGNVVVICGGIRTRGWCRRGLRMPCEKPIWISMSVADPAIAAHEVAHAFHIAAPGQLFDAHEYESVLNALAADAVEDEQTDTIIEGQTENEQAADALARVWGFAVDTTSGNRGCSRRRNLLEDIQRRANAQRARDEQLTTDDERS